jgi:hypothetical protein
MSSPKAGSSRGRVLLVRVVLGNQRSPGSGSGEESGGEEDLVDNPSLVVVQVVGGGWYTRANLVLVWVRRKEIGCMRERQGIQRRSGPHMVLVVVGW